MTEMGRPGRLGFRFGGKFQFFCAKSDISDLPLPISISVSVAVSGSRRGDALAELRGPFFQFPLPLPLPLPWRLRADLAALEDGGRRDAAQFNANATQI